MSEVIADDVPPEPNKSETDKNAASGLWECGASLGSFQDAKSSGTSRQAEQPLDSVPVDRLVKQHEQLARRFATAHSYLEREFCKPRPSRRYLTKELANAEGLLESMENIARALRLQYEFYDDEEKLSVLDGWEIAVKRDTELLSDVSSFLECSLESSRTSSRGSQPLSRSTSSLSTVHAVEQDAAEQMYFTTQADDNPEHVPVHGTLGEFKKGADTLIDTGQVASTLSFSAAVFQPLSDGLVTGSLAHANESVSDTHVYDQSPGVHSYSLSNHSTVPSLPASAAISHSSVQAFPSFSPVARAATDSVNVVNTGFSQQIPVPVATTQVSSNNKGAAFSTVPLTSNLASGVHSMAGMTGQRSLSTSIEQPPIQPSVYSHPVQHRLPATLPTLPSVWQPKSGIASPKPLYPFANGAGSQSHVQSSGQPQLPTHPVTQVASTVSGFTGPSARPIVPQVHQVPVIHAPLLQPSSSAPLGGQSVSVGGQPAIVQHRSNRHLKPIELPIFSGKEEEYLRWKQRFLQAMAMDGPCSEEYQLCRLREAVERGKALKPDSWNS